LGEWEGRERVGVLDPRRLRDRSRALDGPPRDLPVPAGNPVDRWGDPGGPRRAALERPPEGAGRPPFGPARHGVPRDRLLGRDRGDRPRPAGRRHGDAAPPAVTRLSPAPAPASPPSPAPVARAGPSGAARSSA